MPATVVAATAALKVVLRGHGEKPSDRIGVAGKPVLARCIVRLHGFGKGGIL